MLYDVGPLYGPVFSLQSKNSGIPPSYAAWISWDQRQSRLPPCRCPFPPPPTTTGAPAHLWLTHALPARTQADAPTLRPGGIQAKRRV